MCVVCETNRYVDIKVKCNECRDLLVYSMCHYCGCLIIICTGSFCCYTSDNNFDGKRLDDDDGMIMCGKCKK